MHKATNLIHTELEDLIKWIELQNQAVGVKIEPCRLNEICDWTFDKHKGIITHESGKFFTIEGIKVSINKEKSWSQPIINQPEYGILGIISKPFNDDLYLLMQAKIEPGNVNFVQLSPTLQATRSNYSQVHRGRKPHYLDYFLKADSQKLIYDSLQSEQGSRFLGKRNRNMVLLLDDSEQVRLEDNFIWISLEQLKSLMAIPNMVNMDTRTVVAGLCHKSYYALTNRKQGNALLQASFDSDFALNSTSKLISEFTNAKFLNLKTISMERLDKLTDWQIDDFSIYHSQQEFFSVIGVNVEISNREVVHWSQPMIKPAKPGLCAFVCKPFNGVLHFAAQLLLECGNLDVVEFAPTVQCLDEDYHTASSDDYPFLDYLLRAKSDAIVYDTILSEEGGRFYFDQNRYMIVMADDSIPDELPQGFHWISLSQIQDFIKYGNIINIQARNLISTIQV